jgi:[acyl-carrier-protein] S-malonyltransferase
MSKTVLFFPGQGSQYVGMAKDLYEASPRVRELYQLASDEIGVDMAQLSFEGPSDKLKRTRFTQPAILLHSLAVLTVLGEHVPSFDFAAGHSLGEYGALAVAGAFTMEDAVRAVVKRAAFMETACREHPSTMAAIIGLDGDKVAEICTVASGTGVVVPANFNSAVQVVISGEPSAVEQAMTLAREAGAKRTVMLEVGGAFHSPLMESAQARMAEYLEAVTIKDPIRPVVANVTGLPVSGADEIRRRLVEQITAPVLWAQTMKYLKEQNVTRVIEVGPGKVLSGLAKRDMRPEMIVSLDTLADVEAFSTVTV